MRAIQPQQTLVDKSPPSVNNEALGSAAHPQKKTKPIAKKPKATEEQAMDEQSAEALTAEALAEEWPAQATEATLQGQHAGGEDLLLAQADTAVVSDAGGGAASASSTTATTSAVTTSAWGTSLSNTAWLWGGLGLVGVAAAAGGSGSRTAFTSTSDTTAPTFTEGATVGVDFAENGTGAVHTAAATDNVGVAAYAFADGGADNDKFNLDTATGELTFKVAPDFEAPGSAAGSNAYTVTVQATDAAGNVAVQTVTVNVSDVDEVEPVFTEGATVGVDFAENGTGAVHTAAATDNVGVAAYAFADGGADNDKFNLDTATGELTFKAAPDFEAPGSAAGSNAYTVTVQATDAASNVAVQTVTVNVSDVQETLTTAQTFALWQEAADAHGGDTSKDINALNAHSADIVNQRDTTSADGSANQADPAKRLTEYVDQVTGTDIVSDAEFIAGFTLTGQAAAGQAGTIKFWLDNDRTDGTNEVGVQLQHGQDGVSIDYNNATGEYSISFAAGSTALQQATHNTYGSGVHQITVDTDGSGAKNGSEASRLFLVASGTAQTTDTGLVSQNYSVQDKITDDVFVYYFGDPDGAGIGLWTALDNGDSASNQGLVSTNQDSSLVLGSNDFDYYNNTTDNTNATTTPATASNTALHFVTDIAAQTWEFHMAANNNVAVWDEANAQATDHTLWGSNESRQASLAEAIALYSANFGGDSAGGGAAGNTVGAVQPMSNAGSINDYTAAEDNRPGGWPFGVWTAAPTPSGHAPLSLYFGLVGDGQGAYDVFVSAVL